MHRKFQNRYFFFRNQKPEQGKFAQKPEDFMDEEDLGAFGFAPQVLRASSKFQKEPEKETLDRKRKVEANEPLLAHALINNILRPSKETIGKRLLTYGPILLREAYFLLCQFS